MAKRYEFSIRIHSPRRRSAPDVLFVASNDIRAIHGMVIVADEGRLSATQMTTALLDLSPTAVTSVKPETTASASKNSSAKATKPAKEKPRDLATARPQNHHQARSVLR
jgi:hypothetical protein